MSPIPRPPYIRFLLAILFAVIFAGHASAQLYWAGEGLDPATAGGGTWNTSNSQWSSTFPNYTGAVWDSNVANFNGSGGGTVTLGSNLTVKDINFGANAGAFTLLNSTTLLVNGAGLTNNSANNQAITNTASNSVAAFTNSATAANAVLTNSGSASHISFVNTTAANAYITNGGQGSHTGFLGPAATAADANIINSGLGSKTHFDNTNTTAAHAIILNSGEGSQTTFHNGATAANAAIINSTTISGGFGSGTIFFDNATAGNATIATIDDDLSGTTFYANSTAASSTITNGGANSSTAFVDASSGGGAHLINAHPTSFIDISYLNTTGTTAGSIKGNGFLRLGSKNLTVGASDASTAFSGIIEDGGSNGGTGGSFTKVGTGSLTLSGTNTYTGGTEIAGGRLLVSNSAGSGTGSGPVAVDNGTILGGTGTIQLGGGAALTSNGTIAPGASAGQFNIGGNIQLNYPSTLSIEIGGTTAATQYDVLNKNDTGALTLNGKLTVSLINGFTPQPSDSFTVINTQATLGGAFTNARNGGRLNTTDGTGSFAVAYSGTNNVVLSSFGPPLAASRARNISTRANVQTGDNVTIGGFILAGSAARRVMVRALGPSLQGPGVPLPLADPKLDLYGPSGLITSNNDWRDTQETDIQDTGLAPLSDRESAILITLQPGVYTAIMSGNGGSIGIGLVEIYELNPAVDARLVNISTRGLVGTGDNAMIGGMIIGPANTNGARVMVRALGPALQSGGISNFLADPTLALHDGNGTLFAFCDNWKDIQQTDIAATGLAPSNDSEPAIMVTLAPGVWTAIVRGAGDTSGIALVEVYRLQ